MPLEHLQHSGFTPRFTLINSYAHGSYDIGFSMKFKMAHRTDFHELRGGKKDKFERFVNIFLREVVVTLHAREDIKIGMQMEMQVSAGYELFCAWW